MKFAPAFKYSISMFLKVLAKYYIVIILLFITFLAINNATVNSDSPVRGSFGISVGGDIRHEERIMFNGTESCAMGLLFIIILVCYKEQLHFLTQNGISRKTAFVSLAAVLASFAGIIAAAESVIRLVLKGLTRLFSIGVESYSMIEMTYPKFSAGQSGIGLELVNFLFNLSLLTLFAGLGLIVASFYYKFEKTGKHMIAFGIPIFLFILLPIAASSSNLLTHWLISPVMDFFAFVFDLDGRRPYNLIIFSFAASAVSGALSWFAVRRVRVREQ